MKTFSKSASTEFFGLKGVQSLVPF